MFLKYRNYAETTLDGAVSETQTTIRLFDANPMPDTPFLLYLSAGLSLEDLQSAERVLCYEKNGDDYSVCRDWDNMRTVLDGVEATITGLTGDTAFPALFSNDYTYFRIGDSAYLYRYIDGVIEPPLVEDVTDAIAREVGTHWDWSRAAEWPDGTLALMLLGDVNLEEIQDATRPYELPAHISVTTVTVSDEVKFGVDSGIKFENGDLLGRVGTEWISLTQQGGGGDWTPPTGAAGGILIYADEDTLAYSDRIKVLLGEIQLDAVKITAAGLVVGDTTVGDGNISATGDLTVAAIGTLNLEGDIVNVEADEVVFNSNDITVGNFHSVGGYSEIDLPLLINDSVQFVGQDEYPDVPNGSIVYHAINGLMAKSADSWHPLLVEDITSPFPIPAEAYSTVAYDPDLGWYPSSQLILDPLGAEFMQSVVVGEKHPDAPLQAGMIEYVNNDIQATLRHGDSYVRVSLTNYLPSQRLPEVADGGIVFGDNDEWVTDESLSFAGGILASPMVKLGSEETMAGTLRYANGTLEWHNGTGWQEFAGGSASVEVPTADGSMLVSASGAWVEGAGISYADGVLSADKFSGRNIEIKNLGGDITAAITSAGAITGTGLTVDGVNITPLGIFGVANMQIQDLIVSGTLTVSSLNLEELPDEWAVNLMQVGDYTFNGITTDKLDLIHGDVKLMEITPDSFVFNKNVTMPNLDVSGEVAFQYAITIGNEMNPGQQDIPGMIRFNGDFQGHMGNGRWVSFTLSLADGQSGLDGNPEADFGTGLWWDGSQWYRSALRVGSDGAIVIGGTDVAHPGALRWTGTDFQGCVAPGTWVSLSGIGEGDPNLPVGLVEDSTLRWSGSAWLENPQLRSDGIVTTMPLIELEPYENFYDTGAVAAFADAAATTIVIKNFSTIPYGTIRFSNHATLYVVLEATSESMLIGQQADPDLGLTQAVPENTEIYIQGVLPRPAAVPGQIRFNGNDYEGYVENIGWASFTGHLSVLPTRSGDPLLTSGNGLYFDGSMWRAYHEIKMRQDVVEVHKDFDVYGAMEVFGLGTFQGIKLDGDVPLIPGAIRFADNRFQGAIDGEWTYLSSPIRDDGVTNGEMLIHRDGWWFNEPKLSFVGDIFTIDGEQLTLDTWDFVSTQDVVNLPDVDDIQKILNIGYPDNVLLSIYGKSSEGIRLPAMRAFLPIWSERLLLNRDFDEYTSTHALDVDGTALISGQLSAGGLSITGPSTFKGGLFDGSLTVRDNMYIDNGDLSLLNGSIEARALRIEESGFFGSTIRVGHKQGPTDVGSIRYSTPGNAARGDWEGWDGEQWVSFTAGFHGQAIWGDPAEGNIVAFDGERWRPSAGMNIIEGVVHLGRTFLNGAVGDDGELRFNNSTVEVSIGGTWIPLNGGLMEMPEGSALGQVLIWYNGTWMPSDSLRITPQSTLLNNVLQLTNYSELTTPAPAPGQVRFNNNDYEAYIANIGWVSLTGHVAFQKPWDHANRILWSDGDNWVAFYGIEITEAMYAFDRKLQVTGEIEATGRITSGAGVVLGEETEPTEHTLHRDAQNNLVYDNKVVNFGRTNLDNSIPRGVMYYENQQYKNSSAVRMMTRS